MGASSTMKAIVIDKNGGPEALRVAEDFPVPTVKDGEVLVRTKYSGINYIDTYFRSGLYPAPTLPLVLGYEGVGEVVLVEDQNPYGLRQGDEVIWMNMGTYAEYCAVPAEKLVKVPRGISSEDALGSHLMGMTAFSLVKESYEVKKGDTILIHAAAGGVGLLLCQILRSIGATVIGTASTTEKCETAEKHGATYMINYKENPDWVTEVKKIVPDGVDCVYDAVGKTTWQGSLDVVRRKGSVIYYGSASGPVPPLDIQVLGKKNTKIMRAVVMQYIVTREELEHYTGLLFEALKTGILKVNIHKIYDMKDVQQAHRDLEGRLTSGKSLLRISP
ncbi:hypothetical protein AYL99_08780 [Fonsecaea erecta]|uniref:Probable quinone oxidoreductase n=1 Tax=Fonsecaea erecta TaxID=1367422 RepID=A0A178ZA70_9EURO|nr:hypothetical protein AYL99_08780 [Fonsecaea erecta]OAP56668.1 hypothetical protein AYL99_08780 [Fonsecaea erecta]